MLNINYKTLLNYSRVVDFNDFYKGKLPEIIKIRSIIDNLKLIFNLPTDRVLLDVAQGQRVYCFTIISPDVKKIILGQFFYLPLERRLDLFLPDNPTIPLIQWKNKKVEFKNYATLLDKAGLDKLFVKVINII